MLLCDVEVAVHHKFQTVKLAVKIVWKLRRSADKVDNLEPYLPGLHVDPLEPRLLAAFQFRQGPWLECCGQTVQNSFPKGIC